jgi:Isochorismate synthase
MTFICHTPESGTWLGSTPEKILTVEGGVGCTMALAGTMKQSKSEDKAFNWSAKNINEQKIVVDYIKETLISNSDIYNIEEVGPYTSKAGNLLHLRSDFFFKLNEGANIGELLETLYPTPAICGLPKREAYDFINRYECYDRRYYSGIVGWMDDKRVDLYINLRSLEISSGKIYFYAGGGIVESSDIEDEWRETALKINTMKSVFGINCQKRIY